MQLGAYLFSFLFGFFLLVSKKKKKKAGKGEKAYSWVGSIGFEASIGAVIRVERGIVLSRQII
jgi:putative copper export protein